MARKETQIRCSIPLQTLQANEDYGFAEAHTTNGKIGVKVWVYRGTFGEEPVIPEGEQQQRPRRRGRL
jgi:small subunit ribosomal protein S3